MSIPSSNAIAVEVSARYLEDESAPEDSRFVFAYTVSIRNQGDLSARLVSRHWVIDHGTGRIEEVRGKGVVGQQPWLRPGELFEYSSGAVLESSVGLMRGSYQMEADDGTLFDALIPPFALAVPRTLH